MISLTGSMSLRSGDRVTGSTSVETLCSPGGLEEQTVGKLDCLDATSPAGKGDARPDSI